MKVLLVVAAIIGLGAGSNIDMIPDEYMPMVQKCADASGMSLEELDAECSDMEYKEVCGCMALCMSKAMGVIEDDGSVNLDVMIQEAMTAMDNFGIEMSEDEFKGIVFDCFGKVHEDWDECRVAGEMAICVMQEIMEMLGM